jgi:hypothetical protein
MIDTRILNDRRMVLTRGEEIVCPTCGHLQGSSLWGAALVMACERCLPEDATDRRRGRLLCQAYGQITAVVALRPEDAEPYPRHKRGYWYFLFDATGLPWPCTDEGLRTFFESLPRARSLRTTGERLQAVRIVPTSVQSPTRSQGSPGYLCIT